MSEIKEYMGSCHCHKVKYKAKADISKPVTCNCSICKRTGTMLVFVPEEDFVLISGEEGLKNYQFNKKVIDHLFCSNCGVRSFGRGKDQDEKTMYAVNVRCLEGVDLEGLEPIFYDVAAV